MSNLKEMSTLAFGNTVYEVVDKQARESAKNSISNDKIAQPKGVASLDEAGKIPLEQIPDGIQADVDKEKIARIVEEKVSVNIPTKTSQLTNDSDFVTSDTINKLSEEIDDEVTARKNAVDTEKSERRAEIAVERARINRFVALDEGSTTGDAEIMDIRVGADGVTYDSAGDAVRKQIKNVTKQVDEYLNGSDELNIIDLTPYEEHSGYMLRSTDSNNWNLDERYGYKVIPITKTGCTIEIQTVSGTAFFCGLKSYIEPTSVTAPCEFSSDANWSTRKTATVSKFTDTIPDDVKFILINTKMYVSGASADVEFATFKIHKDGTDGTMAELESIVNSTVNSMGDTVEKVKYDLYGDIFTVTEEIPTTFKGINIARVGNSFVLNGTVEENSTGTVGILIAILPIKPTQNYILSGCPQGGNTETYYLMASGFPGGKDIGDGFIGSSLNSTTSIYINAKSGVTLDNVVFTPSFVEQKQSLYVMKDYLNDKTIMAIGDSMVYGQNVGIANTWLAKIGERTGANTINKGSNGAYMSNYPYGISNPKYTSVYQKICNPDNEQGEYIDDETLNSCDYILIFAGTNDANSLNPLVPIGEVDSKDPLEFCGAMNCIIKKLYERVPTIKIGFITPYSKRDTDGNLYEKRVDIISAIKNVCAKYSIPVFDNSLNGGLIFENEHQAQALTLGDNVHLNALGHQYVSTKYEAFLRTL